MRRPGNRLVAEPGTSPFGIIYAEGDASAAVEETAAVEAVEGEEQAAVEAVVPERGAPEIVYLRLGSSALVFFPSQLESTLVRSIPFVIAGLAVALGFKAGLFNIGAEGQLYIGSILAVWVGFSPIFAGLPSLIHIPLAIIAGLLGGALWGAIPGALKAFTGAHEVINTIMLNFVAIRLVDWLIKSTDPVIMLDQSASTPRTPFINQSAMLPTFDNIAPIWYFIAGALVLACGLWSQRDRLTQNPRVAIRPIVNAGRS
ncbi:MAG: ABC transporter permease, partial [Anaerolineae bacterium]|nr:ABC transporter permease [Phycisphaerae bacterium]